MSYPVLINGAAINSSELVETESVELSFGGIHSAIGALLVAESNVFEIGTPRAGPFAIAGDVELAFSETFALVNNLDATPDSVELAFGGVHVLRATLLVAGTHVLEIGEPSAVNGTDIAAVPSSVELAFTPFHIITTSSAPANRTLSAAGQRPFEIGVPSVGLGTVTVVANGYHSFEIGTPSTALGLPVTGAHVMDFGTPSTTVGLLPASGWPMEIGSPSVSTALLPESVELSWYGQPSIASGYITLAMNGVHCFEIGEPQQPLQGLRVRQSFPFEIGQPSAHRGATC